MKLNFEINYFDTPVFLIFVFKIKSDTLNPRFNSNISLN